MSKQRIDAASLTTIAEVEHARHVLNRRDGRIVNEALDRRLQARERELAIELLGWAPEEGGSRYAATTGEMLRWAREAGSL